MLANLLLVFLIGSDALIDRHVVRECASAHLDQALSACSRIIEVMPHSVRQVAVAYLYRGRAEYAKREVVLPFTVLVSSAAWAQTKLEASIFSYDGKDFVRTNTTLTDKGQSAVNTKLDPSSAAYKALTEKHSFIGPASVFGQNYDASYAPLTDGAGKLTGALFVGVPK
jgi:hypothetical protein